MNRVLINVIDSHKYHNFCVLSQKRSEINDFKCLRRVNSYLRYSSE